MKGDFHHLPRDTLCEGDALDERREVAPNGGAEQEGGDPEPEMVEDGACGDEVVEMCGVAETYGEKGGEPREIVEVENAPSDEDEQEAVDMEQGRGGRDG